MSNPLASAEARQAAEWQAEKILGWKCVPLEDGDETQRLSFWVGEWVAEREASEMETNAYWFLVDAYAEKSALAESYADLVRERDKLDLKLSMIRLIAISSQKIGACECCAEIEKQAEENVEYLLGKLDATESLNRELVEAAQEMNWSPRFAKAIEAAINSATPKKGEQHEG